MFYSAQTTSCTGFHSTTPSNSHSCSGLCSPKLVAPCFCTTTSSGTWENCRRTPKEWLWLFTRSLLHPPPESSILRCATLTPALILLFYAFTYSRDFLKKNESEIDRAFANAKKNAGTIGSEVAGATSEILKGATGGSEAKKDT